MDKLQLPHAKLFYFSAELYKNSTITENEKLKMKGIGYSYSSNSTKNKIYFCFKSFIINTLLIEMVINDEP